MPLTAAQVIADGIPMTIAVPSGPDVKRRICTYARVMARYYRGDPRCAWCEERLTGGVLVAIPASEDGDPQSYCSTACWLAAS